MLIFDKRQDSSRCTLPIRYILKNTARITVFDTKTLLEIIAEQGGCRGTDNIEDSPTIWRTK
jgi:hypothetical protein